jgi:arylsulfatase
LAADFLAAAGVPDIGERLRVGYAAGDKSFKVHLDGYNLLPHLTGEDSAHPHKGFFYFSDDGDLTAPRYDNWKAVFMEQRGPGTLMVWAEPFVALRAPKLYNLRTDPYERADVTSNTYYDWLLQRTYLVFAASVLVTEFLATFAEYPPRQKAASFTIDQIVRRMTDDAFGEGR